jgi:predicted lipid-binding transport protein (Tim44 family)
MLKNLFSLCLMITLVAALGGSGDAWAKGGFGGGKSFGSMPKYNQSSNRQSAPASAPNRNSSAAQQANAPQKSGFLGGMGGMLGGSLLGSALGALFFGGAFDGLGFMDILIFGLIAFVLYKLFARRKPQPQGAGGVAVDPMGRYAEVDNSVQQRGMDTDRLFGGSGGRQSVLSQSVDAVVPAGFDSEAFVRQAEELYRNMQQAWRDRDMGEMRQFCSDAVFAEVQDMLRGGIDHSAEVELISSKLIEVNEIGRNYEVAMIFVARVTEADGDVSESEEVWHLLKAVDGRDPRILVDGIQQIEE